MSANGITVHPSPYTVKETVDRIEHILRQQSVTIYARINQQEEVGRIGHELLPLEFLMFGNPRVGGPVMKENPLAALELPLKIIAWQDGQQKVWVAHNDAWYIRERYSLTEAISRPLDPGPLVLRALEG